MSKRNTVLCCATLLISNISSADTEIASTLADQTQLAVTIYNDNLALIKDQRHLTLPAGQSALAFREISAQILPETALLRSVTQTNALSVIEQNFDFDLLSPDKLLEKYVGQEIGVIRSHPTSGEDVTEYGTLLSVQQGPVIQFGERIETGRPSRFVFPRVPDNLRDKPTLVMHIANEIGKPQNVELSYLTQGLQWKADYVLSLNQNDTTMDLNGWVTLTNTSGSSYPNAQLQLVAGSVHRAPQPKGDMMVFSRTLEAAAAAPAMTQENLFEYHLYTLAHKTTLADNQTKQVALLNASDIPVKKELQLRGSEHYYYDRYNEIGEKLPVEVFLSFRNDETSHLGIPLPKGTLRAYKSDSRGNAQFIGEDAIEHTAKNEDVRIKLGSAFDVTARKVQTDFRRVSPHLIESEYQFTLKNAKDQAVSVNIIEPIPGDWEIKQASQPHRKTSAGTASWRIDIPAGSEKQLTYRVQIK